jgi:Domain of unknown function (DUF4394)
LVQVVAVLGAVRMVAIGFAVLILTCVVVGLATDHPLPAGPGISPTSIADAEHHSRQIQEERMTCKMSGTALVAAATAVAAFGFAASAQAATVAGLVDGKTLVWIDTTAKRVTKTVPIQGGNIIGIDVRPADKQLYGVTSQGKIVIIDAATGKVTDKSQISDMLPAGSISVDFNPVADRMRIIGANGTSLRINVDDGKTTVDGSLKYADADASKGKTPKAAAAAYSNSVAGTKETALYDIDATAGALVKQAPPNDGILNTIGSLGMKVNGPIGFDIVADGSGGNQGWMMVGSSLYSVDLVSGKATMAAKISGIKGKLQDIAIMPAM